MTQMYAAHDSWDSTRVIELGAQAEADMLIIDFPLKDKVQIEMFEMMARAFSRTGQYSRACDYFENLLALFDPVEQFQQHTRTKMMIADMSFILGYVDKAKVLFEQVHAIGEQNGNFEFHSKSCLGLSKIEKKAGNETRALELARQALLAAELLLDGEYSKSRDAAQAILAIVDLSDITSESFDENLLVRLEELTTAVDSTENGGSSLVVKASELQWRRAFAMSRWATCGNLCAKTMRLAKQTRFQQNPDVQSVYGKALETIETLHGLGLIAMNPER